MFLVFQKSAANPIPVISTDKSSPHDDFLSFLENPNKQPGNNGNSEDLLQSWTPNNLSTPNNTPVMSRNSSSSMLSKNPGTQQNTVEAENQNNDPFAALCE